MSKGSALQQPTRNRRPGFFWRVLLLALFLLLLIHPGTGRAGREAQTDVAVERARDLLSQLTPEERVGQLFLVTFQGTDLSPESEIYDLITEHHIGGVILRRENNNFVDGELALNSLLSLTEGIQTIRWEASQSESTASAGDQTGNPTFIPLLVGISQEGDGYPYDQILSGVTPLPNEMALGATWNPELANQVGQVLGQELSALGINLVLGPSLDVLESPQPEGAGHLGTRTFGGDPFWVAQLGEAYISGVHTGSNGQVAVIAKHFPGYGSADRLPEEEIATVPKSLEELNRFDLVPFASVTRNDLGTSGTADGLLNSHIRYQGFQGSIRSITRPISLDTQYLPRLLEISPFNSWRSNGGLLVSDDLGSEALRRFYALNRQQFDMSHRVAPNALIAGNDLLYVADFSSGEQETYLEAIQTFGYFAQKYREDQSFASRVDEAVLRVLTLKFRLYPNFTLTDIVPSPSRLAEVGTSEQVTYQVASQAATLISPNQTDLTNEIPDPPNNDDRIVFITDARQAQTCPECPIQSLMSVRALEDVVLHRYGPDAGQRVSPNYLVSYSLEDLKTVLNAPVRGASDMERDLARANWIIVSMLNPTSEYPSYEILGRFLAERPELFRQSRLIVFAFSAPYYLDATNITKLTAYYGLYSRAPQFIDVAASLLFQEMSPGGALPVTVPGTGYDLNRALDPNPGQVIPLRFDLGDTEASSGTPTPGPSPTPPVFRVNDQVPVTTGVILDYNGKAVQDGTTVEFTLSTGGEAGAISHVETTSKGIAKTTFVIPNAGAWEIRARSDFAQSEPLTFGVPAPGEDFVPLTPTPEPTLTLTPTPTETPEPEPVVQVTPQPPPPQPVFTDWIMALLVAGGVGWSSYRLAVLVGQPRWGLRGGFLALIGGLLAYSYLALQMPGSEDMLRSSVSRGVFLATLIGTGIGLSLAWFWQALSASSNGPPTGRFPSSRTGPPKATSGASQPEAE